VLSSSVDWSRLLFDETGIGLATGRPACTAISSCTRFSRRSSSSLHHIFICLYLRETNQRPHAQRCIQACSTCLAEQRPHEKGPPKPKMFIENSVTLSDLWDFTLYLVVRRHSLDYNISVGFQLKLNSVTLNDLERPSYLTSYPRTLSCFSSSVPYNCRHSPPAPETRVAKKLFLPLERQEVSYACSRRERTQIRSHAHFNSLTLQDFVSVEIHIEQRVDSDRSY